MLTTDDHRRDSAGLRYVYPVVSRRAGGVSIGINLNPNNACNWACVYCQVENLTRGGPPPLDLELLRLELSGFLDDALYGDFMQRAVPPEARRLIDVAFSGNGEPTSAPEFADAVACVGEVLQQKAPQPPLKLTLITNGSLVHRPEVQSGLRQLGALGGEAWFKLDRAEADDIAKINGVPMTPEKALRHLRRCGELLPTWVQTCWFAMDGAAPSAQAEAAYLALLGAAADRVVGVHLYGLARPSLQPAAGRLQRLSADALQAFAERIQKETGIRVNVAP